MRERDGRKNGLGYSSNSAIRRVTVAVAEFEWDDKFRGYRDPLACHPMKLIRQSVRLVGGLRSATDGVR